MGDDFLPSTPVKQSVDQETLRAMWLSDEGVRGDEPVELREWMGDGLMYPVWMHGEMTWSQ